MKKVDVLMATYNGEKYLKEQIDSILNQTYKDFRLIISDDNSNDNTLNILKEYQKKDSRIIIYEQDKNIGSTENFEFLLKKVQADYFFLSDQDDFWDKDKIKDYLEKFSKSNVDLIFSDLEIVDENLKTIHNSFWKEKGLYKKIKKHCNYKGLYLNNFVTGCTICCKSKFINKILPLPKKSKYVIHDYWIPIIVSQNGNIGYLDKTYVKYRQHSNNQIGSKRYTDEFKNIKEIRKLFIDVKLEHFHVFLENNLRFKKELQNLNKQALEYYENLEKVRIFDLKPKHVFMFFRLYRYEGFMYSLKNFLILHFPLIKK